MPLSRLDINYTGNMSAGKQNGEDHVSALIFLNSVPPASWNSNTPIRSFTSLAQCEAADIIASDPPFMESHYQIKEFYKRSPGALLFIYYVNGANGTIVNSDYVVPNAEYFYNATNGKCRQIGINLSNNAIPVNDMTEAQFDEFLVALWEEFAGKFFDGGDYAHSPNVCVYGLNSLPSFYDDSFLNTAVFKLNDGSYNMPSVAMLIAGSNSGDGKVISDSLSVALVPALGATIGVLSKIKVHKHVGIPEESNIADVNTGEYERIAHAFGATNTEAPQIEIEAANEKGYMGLRKHAGFSGTFIEDTYTICDASITDRCTLELNRVYGKALRGLRKVLIPKLNSPLYLKNGKLRTGTIELFKSIASKPLMDMLSAGEISEFSVSIDSAQDVLLTSTLSIEVVIVPVGVARNIVVSMAFAVKLK